MQQLLHPRRNVFASPNKQGDEHDERTGIDLDIKEERNQNAPHYLLMHDESIILIILRASIVSLI